MASPESREWRQDGSHVPPRHQHLIERARGLVDALDVVVMHGPDDQLAPELRTAGSATRSAEHPQVQVHAVADERRSRGGSGGAPRLAAGHLLHQTQ